MKIDDTVVLKLEQLARLQLSGDERTQLKQDLNNILQMVANMDAVKTEGVHPLVYLSDAINGFRQDEVQGQLSQADALRNAPDHDNTFFRVPKVIDL